MDGPIKLTYIGRLCPEIPESPRMWNVIEPELPGYDYSRGYPTLGLQALKELGLI